ncbi:MAG: trypsin-like peptidase domain-containing protein [Clostridia bacterium]|nr:trypsin-like peptidase domain-containing protein [Clostridia bacterium]
MNNTDNEYQFSFDELDPFYAEALKNKKKKKGGAGKVIGILALLLVFACVVSIGSIMIYKGSSDIEMSVDQPSSQNVPSVDTHKGQNTVTYLPTVQEDALTVPQIYQKNIDSVVAITTYVQQGGYEVPAGTGTGIVMTENGYIITNAHVVDGGTKIMVKLNNSSEHQATIVGSDSKVDIAVIKIEATGLAAGEFGDPNELVFGEPAVVIGNPLGSFAGTVTQGIISATSREIEIGGYIMKVMQTDAAVNPGNSGGPIINCRGEIIGVVSSKISQDGVEGIGFAIPMDTALSVANDFIEYGYVKNRPMLGVSVEEINSYYAQYFGMQPGLRVASVQDGSAADIAGILPGDRIAAFNGVEVSTSAELNYEKDKCAIGDTVEVTIIRNGQQLILPLTLKENTAN